MLTALRHSLAGGAQHLQSVTDTPAFSVPILSLIGDGSSECVKGKDPPVTDFILPTLAFFILPKIIVYSYYLDIVVMPFLNNSSEVECQKLYFGWTLFVEKVLVKRSSTNYSIIFLFLSVEKCGWIKYVWLVICSLFLMFSLAPSYVSPLCFLTLCLLIFLGWQLTFCPHLYLQLAVSTHLSDIVITTKNIRLVQICKKTIIRKPKFCYLWVYFHSL